MTHYIWSAGRFISQPEPVTRGVVIDSFLVDDGHATGLDAHHRRFRHSVAELCGWEVPDDAYAQLMRVVPSEGQYFPRLGADHERLTLWVRPAPRLRTTTTLWIPVEEDPRTEPTHKGPDYDVLGVLRAAAQRRGADDAVLHRDGYIVEAAHAAIYFDDGHRILIPEAPRLPSVTLSRVCAGRRVEERPVLLDEARTLSAFATSALHGPTPVVGWLDCA